MQVLVRSCGKFCLSVWLAYNAPSICRRQNTSATAYSAPTRTGETGQAPLFVQQHRSDERAEDWHGSTMGMTHTRNIRDDMQQAGDPSVVALAAPTAVAACTLFYFSCCRTTVITLSCSGTAACRWDMKWPTIGGKGTFPWRLFPHRSCFTLKKNAICLGQRWVGLATP